MSSSCITRLVRPSLTCEELLAGEKAEGQYRLSVRPMRDQVRGPLRTTNVEVVPGILDVQCHGSSNTGTSPSHGENFQWIKGRVMEVGEGEIFLTQDDMDQERVFMMLE